MTKTNEGRSFTFFLVKLALFVLTIRCFVIAPFNIPSESMQPRLLIGDFLLVSKWPYGFSRYSMPFHLPLIPGHVLARTPERGDVVVFAAPANDRQDWIKRVVGLPGDTVQMRDGTLYLNGKAVPKHRVDDLVIPVTPNMIAATAADHGASPCFQASFEFQNVEGANFCRYPRFRETLPNGRSYDVLDLVDGQNDNTALVRVPEGRLFVMGDNRDRSADSRVPVDSNGVGLLPIDNLIGRAQVSFFSTDGSASLLPWTWFGATRFGRIGQGF